jgi:hypothetical protein
MPARTTRQTMRLVLDLDPTEWEVVDRLSLELGLAPQAVLAAFWRLGASVYMADELGKGVPPIVTQHTPQRLSAVWREWLHQKQAT